MSLVSHSHGSVLVKLMGSLNNLCHSCVSEVILTVNLPEPGLLEKLIEQKWNFELTIVQNTKPKGFGANHNAAFKLCHTDYFCVLNPDIDFSTDPFPELLSCFTSPAVGCAIPVQMDAFGNIQDYARELPTLKSLLKRHLRLSDRTMSPEDPEWVNGAFMLYPAKVFERLGGFDQRYFMYCEDVDICLRLQLAGFKLAQSTATVVHAAQRNTRANLRHLTWHVTSLVRLWLSPAYRKFYVRRRSAL